MSLWFVDMNQRVKNPGLRVIGVGVGRGRRRPSGRLLERARPFRLERRPFGLSSPRRRAVSSATCAVTQTPICRAAPRHLTPRAGAAAMQAACPTCPCPDSGSRAASAACLRGLDFAPLLEVSPAPGLRVDVMALGPRGEVWIVECKSCREDFVSDRKWTGYLDWCDRFFWAVDDDFPTEILPDDAGLILADAYGAEIERMPAATPLAGARRQALTQRFARTAAARLRQSLDPGWGAWEPF